MASAAEKIIPNRYSGTDTVVDFSPERLKAPFFLRCAAFSIDYMILLTLPVGWLIASRFFSDNGTTTLGTFAWVIGFLLLGVNFVLFPLLRGQTIGKLFAGITIVNIDGTHLRFGGVIRRNIVGYLVTAATLGLGFVLSAINSSGRSLHDFIGGTVVIRGRRTHL